MAQGKGKFLGTNADSPNRTRVRGFNYNPRKGGGGTWTNRAGVQVGESDQEDSMIRGRKSTGDFAPIQQAAKLHRLSRSHFGNQPKASAARPGDSDFSIHINMRR